MPKNPAGSARRSQSGSTATNKDGTPRKKPGPAPGTPRGAGKKKPTASNGRKKRGTRPKKKFLLYAVEGNELSFICEAEGATGQIAAVNAVKNGTVAADTPVVPIPPRTLTRTVEVEAENIGVRYKIKAGKKRAARKAPAKKAPVQHAAEEAQVEAPAAPKSARASARTARSSRASAPATSGNPFAE
jgi:hypothetical protein